MKNTSKGKSPIDSGEFDYCVYLGHNYFEQREIDQAIASFSKAIGMNPKWCITYYCRGLVYYMKGELDKALADFITSLRLNYKDIYQFMNENLLYKTVGRLDELLADYALTKYNCADFLRFIDPILNPTDSYWHSNQGDKCFVKGNLDEAIANYTKAIEMNHSYSLYYYHRAMAYYVKGELSKSLEDYNTANKLGRDAVLSYMNDEEFYKDIGRLDKLLANYIQVVNILGKPK